MGAGICMLYCTFCQFYDFNAVMSSFFLCLTRSSDGELETAWGV